MIFSKHNRNPFNTCLSIKHINKARPEHAALEASAQSLVLYWLLWHKQTSIEVLHFLPLQLINFVFVACEKSKRQNSVLVHITSCDFVLAESPREAPRRTASRSEEPSSTQSRGRDDSPEHRPVETVDRGVGPTPLPPPLPYFIPPYPDPRNGLESQFGKLP